MAEKLSRREFIAAGAASATARASLIAADSPAAAAEIPADAKKGPLGKVVGELPPGRYDSHIHIHPGDPKPDVLAKAFKDAGLAGGVIFSQRPERLHPRSPVPPPPEVAMDKAIEWCSGSPLIYPFYWIDPGAPDAVELVNMAVEKGFYGFKVIRGSGKPVDSRTLRCYKQMAKHGKPLTFHSGILWDGQDSSDNFRPANWEGLLEVPHLRFCLAHVSWPWYDECIAVYGKLLNAIASRGFEVPEMFIDTTPGTPKVYRQEVLRRLFLTGYDVVDHVQFGTDCSAHNYNHAWSGDWRKTDDKILGELGLGEKQLDSYYRGSLQRFLFGGDNTGRNVPIPDGRDGNPNKG